MKHAEPSNKPPVENTATARPKLSLSAPVATGSFYFCWNPARRAPRQRHASREAATAEAQRLAMAQPGETFHVLRALLVDTARALDSPTDE